MLGVGHLPVRPSAPPARHSLRYTAPRSERIAAGRRADPRPRCGTQAAKGDVVDTPPVPDGARTSRRRFVQSLAAAAAIAPLATVLPAAAQTPTPPATPPPTTPPAQPAGANSVDPEVAAEAKLVTDMIERRFGSRFDQAQLQLIREDVEGNLGAGRALRKLELRNADEPDIVFRARPLEG